MKQSRILGAVVAAVLLLGGCSAPSHTVDPADTWTVAPADPTTEPATVEPTEAPEIVRDYSGLEAEIAESTEWAASVATVAHVEADYEYPYTEHQVLLDLHSMSHQKVIADHTWCASFITSSDLDLLYHMVDKHPGWENNAVYLPIMDRWAAGDFSHAVEDYNALAELFDNHIAPAKRAKTAQEEAAYLAEWAFATSD